MLPPSPELVARIIQRQTEPFVGDPPHADSFYNAMGRMVLMWGRLEQTLDDIVFVAVNLARKEGSLPKLQITLTGKLRLLRDIYYEHQQLTHLREEAVSTADQIKINAENRNMIIHSGWLGFDGGPPPALQMRYLKVNNDNITISDFQPSLENIIQMTANFYLCRSRMIAFLFSTFEAIDPEIWKRAYQEATYGDHLSP